MDGLLGKGDMSKGQQILNSEEVEFLLDSGSSGAKQGQDAAQGAQQAVTMRGDLDQMPLGDVFQTLGLTKMEGVLRVCNPVEQRIVYFRNGLLRIVVPPRLLMRRLGQRLLQAGVLTADDLRAALTEQKRTPRSLDEVLVSGGFVSQEQLDDIVALQVSEELFGLFTWTHGTFEFWKGPPQDEQLQKRLDGCHEFEVNSLLLEVARRSDEWEGILASLQNLDEVPVRTSEPEPDSLDETQRTVLNVADGKHTYRELADLTVLAEFECARIARSLVQLGLIETASAQHMLALAQNHLDQGHGKIALILTQAMCDRRDERSVETSRALATLLRGAGEPKLASAVLLESAQLQSDAQLALQLGQEARQLSPRDLATISFLRTTMLAHMSPSSPELEHVTLDLLDGLLADGDVDRLFAVVEETKQLSAYTPEIMVREARGLAKRKDKDAAIEVMLRASQAFEAKGDRRQQIELLEVAYRLDRDRKDIHKQIQALRSTPRTRAIRMAAAACATVLVLGSGVVWWTGSAEAERVRSEGAKIRELLTAGDLPAASLALTALAESGVDGSAMDGLRQAVRAAESERAHKTLEAARKDASVLLQEAGDLIAKGELAMAFSVYQRVRANPELKAEADSAAAARFEALQRDLQAAVVKLPDLLPAPPTDLLDRQKVEETLTMLQRSVPQNLCAAARSILRLRDADALPPIAEPAQLATLVDAATRAAPLLEKGIELLAAYETASQRSSEQRRLDPLFKEALEKERGLDFAGALEVYRKLASSAANTKDLGKHFAHKVAELEGILGVCEGIAAATKNGDYATAKRELMALQQSFPDIPFHMVVRLPVRLSTSMPGARVRWNGAEFGATPQLASYTPGAPNLIELQLDGFHDVRMSLPESHDGAVEVSMTLRAVAERTLEAPIDQPMAQAEDRTFASDRDGGVVAFDNRTGEQAWRTRDDDATNARTAPQLYQGLVLTASPDASLRAQDQSTGNVRWQREDLRTDLAPAPLDGRIAVSLGKSRIVLLDPRTGADLATWNLPAAAQGELASNARTLVTALDDGSVAALDVKSMSTRWRTSPGEFGTSLLITESGVAALADDGKVALLDLDTGKPKWQRELKGTPLARPTANREALAVSFDDEIVVLSLTTGEDALRIRPHGVAWSSAACMLGDYLAAPTRSGETLVYSLQSASPRFSLASERAQSLCGDRRSDTLQAAGKKLRVYRAMP